jgi:hypothetical protein
MISTCQGLKTAQRTVASRKRSSLRMAHDDYIIHASLALLSQEHLADFSHPAKEELTVEQRARMEASRNRAAQSRRLM